MRDRPQPVSHSGEGSTGYTTPSDYAHNSEDTPLLGRSRSTTPTTPGSASPTARRSPHIAHDADDAAAAQHPVSPLRAACIATTMGILIWVKTSNMSGMTMVQGHIAEDLEAYDEAMWFTSVFLIVFASTAPLAGKLATIFPVGAMILASALFFTVGSVISYYSGSSDVFIAGRVFAGAGAGCVVTLSLILVFQLASAEKRGLLVGAVNTAFTAGVATGAVVYGALLPVIGWRVLFLLQAPVGLMSGVGVYLSVPHFKSIQTKDQDHGKTIWQKLQTIDYAGAVLLTAGLVLFLYGLAGSIKPLPMIVSSVPLGLFVVNEYRIASDPLIPISVLQSRGVLFSCLSQFGLMAARWSVLFYTPIFVLAVRGLSPALAGSVLIPTNLGFGIGGLVVGWLHVQRTGSFWLSCLVSISLFGVALLGLSLTSNASSPVWLYVVLVFGNGLCTGAALNYTLAHLLHVAVPGTQYIATGLWATFRGFAGSFGTSVGGGIFSRTLRDYLAGGFARLDGTADLSPERANLVKRLVGNPNLVFGGSLSEAERAVAVSGYEVSLKVLYTCAVVLTAIVLFFQAGTGWTAPAAAVAAAAAADDHENADHNERRVEA